MKKILILMTGSIAAYKACNIISKLKQKNYELEVVLTKSCQEFIGPATIEGLTGKPPHTDMYETGHVMDHIHLVRWADLILVAPATANFINRCAVGIGDDFLTTLFLAHDFTKPFLIAPAMNTKMYLHPATQNSLAKLKEFGVSVLETASGVLACGENGWGRLLEPELIVSEVERKLFGPLPSGHAPYASSANNAGKKILVTAGGTVEPLDAVRSISNTSTGRTGVEIARTLSRNGFQVTLFLAKNHRAQIDDFSGHVHFYETFKDLQNGIETEISSQSFDGIIHAAAVSDYSVESFSSSTKGESSVQKMGDKISSGQFLNVQLRPNPKIINDLKQQSKNKNMILIGFKLTHTRLPEEQVTAVKKLFDQSHCDYVVQNDLNEISKAHHKFQLYSRTLQSETFASAESLSQKLNQIFIEDTPYDLST